MTRSEQAAALRDQLSALVSYVDRVDEFCGQVVDDEHMGDRCVGRAEWLFELASLAARCGQAHMEAAARAAKRSASK